jgi:hypothetical protein
MKKSDPNAWTHARLDPLTLMEWPGDLAASNKT